MRDQAALSELQAIGALTVRDYRGTRQVALGEQLTLVADLAQALEGAQLVVIPLPSTTHLALAAEVAPLLRDGQVVFLPPGTFGSYVFAKTMHDCGNPAEVAFAETGTLPYLVRKHGPDQGNQRLRHAPADRGAAQPPGGVGVCRAARGLPQR